MKKVNIPQDDGTIIWVDPTSSAVVCYEFPPSGEKSQLKQIPMPPAMYIEKCMAGAPGEDSYTIWLQKNQPAFVGPNVQFVTEPGRCRYYGYDMIISMNDPFYSVNVISYGKRSDWRAKYVQEELRFLWTWMNEQCEDGGAGKCHKEW